MKRIALTKKVRFEVFKRDGFKCVYCGQTPPNVLLEADHVIPVSKGGTNHIDNLVCSCYDCNRGKSANELTNLPETIQSKAELLKLKTKQYKELKKLQIELDSIIDQQIVEVHNIYKKAFPEYYLTDKFLLSVRHFITQLGVEVVKDAMSKACWRLNSSVSIKYFCGICWNKIKGL